jgi:hypothetical protein
MLFTYMIIMLSNSDVIEVKLSCACLIKDHAMKTYGLVAV